MAQRADIALTERGLVQSRSRAKTLIAEGKVCLNGRPLTKPAELVEDSDVLTLEADLPFVGRGGLKLAGALDELSEAGEKVTLSAAVKLCEMPAAGSQAVNVGSQDTRPLRAFAEEIMETAGRDRGLLTFEERPVGPEGTPFLSPDTSRLTSLTGFAPAVRFAEGIRRRLHI